MAEIVKLRSTGTAASQLALPGCDARIVHTLPLNSVTDVPLTVHTVGVTGVKLTVRPDDAVAEIVIGDAVIGWSASGANVIVWLKGELMAKLRSTGAAGR